MRGAGAGTWEGSVTEVEEQGGEVLGRVVMRALAATKRLDNVL